MQHYNFATSFSMKLNIILDIIYRRNVLTSFLVDTYKQNNKKINKRKTSHHVTMFVTLTHTCAHTLSLGARYF